MKFQSELQQIIKKKTPPKSSPPTTFIHNFFFIYFSFIIIVWLRTDVIFWNRPRRSLNDEQEISHRPIKFLFLSCSMTKILLIRLVLFNCAIPFWLPCSVIFFFFSFSCSQCVTIVFKQTIMRPVLAPLI